MNRQIRVGDSKNVIVFDFLVAGHVIRRMRSGRVRILNGKQLINKELIGAGSSNLVPRLVTTRHAQQLFKVKRTEVKVTKSRDVSADKNAITRQCMVTSTSNLVGIIDVGVDACGILSRSVGQTNRK